MYLHSASLTLNLLADQLAITGVKGDTRRTIAAVLAISLEPAQAIRRWDEARQPTENEFKSTLMVAVPIDAASAKVRSGPPADADEDIALPIWAGEIPYALLPGDPIPAPDLPYGVEFPGYLQHLID